MRLYQQGDVLIKSVDYVPPDATKDAELILAEGEATGHRHTAAGAGVAVLESRGTRFLCAPSGAEVMHPEHKTIRIPPGNYRVDRVREYDHFEEAAWEESNRPLINKRRPVGGHQPTRHWRHVKD